MVPFVSKYPVVLPPLDSCVLLSHLLSMPHKMGRKLAVQDSMHEIGGTCPLVAHIPKPAKGDSHFEEEQNKLDHALLEKGVELFWHNPSIRGLTVQYMENMLLGKKKINAKKQEEQVELQSGTMAAVDDEFKAACVLSHTKLSTAGLASAKSYDCQVLASISSHDP